jgi:2,6-dihydroxypyridine 3-monooxygenase
VARDRLRIVVAGGSLAGLNAALWLRAAGCDVDVLERSRRPLEGQGAGIVLNPATVRWFTESEGRSVAELGIGVPRLRYLDVEGNVAAEHDEPYLLASYDSLYRGLVRAFGSERYHLGREVVAAEDTRLGVAVTLSDGGRHAADVLVWADGIGSTGRRLLAPGATSRYAGYVAWRGTMDPAMLSRDARAALRDAITYCVLPDSHFITYPIPTGQGVVRNWLWYHNTPSDPALETLMTDRTGVRRSVSVPPGAVAERHVAAMHARARGLLAPPLLNLVRATPEPFLQAVFDIEVARMAFGRACLIGDAAFAARPHAAAGSAKAAEDGRRLAGALAGADGAIDSRLRDWEAGQLAIGRDLVARSRDAGERLQRGAWPVGAPLPYGLHEVGDSMMTAGVPATGLSAEP